MQCIYRTSPKTQRDNFQVACVARARARSSQVTGTTLMSVLAELDQTQAELQSEFPGWRIWYVYRPGSVSWAARREPVLNTQSAEDLRTAILKVVAGDDRDVSTVLERSSAPLASHQEGNDDPEDTLDLLSVIADECAEDD